jgi:hypothetical protein
MAGFIMPDKIRIGGRLNKVAGPGASQRLLRHLAFLLGLVHHLARTSALNSACSKCRSSVKAWVIFCFCMIKKEARSVRQAQNESPVV